MINYDYHDAAKRFVNAIRLIAGKPDNLDNLEWYLSNHFAVWLDKYANSPDDLSTEMKCFAEMEM